MHLVSACTLLLCLKRGGGQDPHSKTLLQYGNQNMAMRRKLCCSLEVKEWHGHSHNQQVQCLWSASCCNCFLLQCIWYDVLCCAVLCCAVLCCAVLCCAVLCCAVLCCCCAVPVLYCAVQCLAVLWYLGCAMPCSAVACCAVKHCEQ